MLGYSKRCNKGKAFLLLLTHLYAVKLYNVEAETLSGGMKSSKTSLQLSQCFTVPIILSVVPVGMNSKKHYLFNVPEIHVHNSASRSCNLETFGAADFFPVCKEFSFADESRPEARCLPSRNLITICCFVCTNVL